MEDAIVLKSNTVNDLVKSLPEHTKMLETISKSLPEVKRATSLFNKSQSQFMDNMLTVSHFTPLRNLRQILAEMNKTTAALREAYFKNKKKEVEIQILERDVEAEEDHLKADLIDIEIMEKRSELEASQGYISGAIRKLTNYTEQYNSIMKEKGVENFNEIDFEEEEERYHIMKAFEQGVTSARPRMGVVDEGNQIYFYQVGINGAAAQKDVIEYLSEEGKLLTEGKTPSHQMFLKFLNDMADKYQGSAKEFAKAKGMTGSVTEHAALSEGDKRLFIENQE